MTINNSLYAIKGQGLTISSGSVTISIGGLITLTSESGFTDTLDTMLMDSDLAGEVVSGYYPFILLFAATGHAITITDDHAALSTNQFALANGANVTITENIGLMVVRVGATWLGVGSTSQLDGGVIDANTAQILANKILTSLTLRGVPSGYTGAEQVFDQVGVTTTDATVTNIVTVALATNQSMMLEALVHGKKDDESAGIVAKVVAGAKRAGSNISLIGTPSITVVEDAGTQDVTVDIDTGTQTLRVRVTGIAAEGWTWLANYSYSILTTFA